MFRNFQELEVVLNVCNDKIYSIRIAIKYAEWRSEFKKVSDLKKREHRIRKKIINYIAWYKIKMADNYLEKRIYGNELEEIELYYQEYFKDISWICN